MRPPFSAAAATPGSVPLNLDRHRIEEALTGDGDAGSLQSGGEPHGETVDVRGDRLQPVRSVPDRIGSRHIGEQRLRRADVGGRLVAADMLLARLQRQPVARPALAVDRLADQPTWHQPRQPVRDGQKRHAGRQNPSARRSAACCRQRCRRRVRPAGGRPLAPARSATKITTTPAALAFSIAAPWSR